MVNSANLTTKRQALGQVLFCLGCCCGRTGRGKPPVPVERLKQIWKEEKLNRTVQLTISGCLGPCDVANVAVVSSRLGMEWFGGFGTDADYDLLIEWARKCHQEARLLPTPERLGPFRFERYLDTTVA
ncbi:MAG: (2Fe-2S) ferredoxin domain-containing protein [Gemmataceae bacterium]